MPPLEDLDQHQPALLWAKKGRDRYNETLREPTPEELSVQWEDGVRFLKGPDGTALQLDATVAPPREIPLGSLLWKGGLEDWNQTKERRVMEVVTQSVADDLKGRSRRYEYGLSFYKGALPDAS